VIPADGRRVRAGVLGSPVGHSLSPVLHNAAYAALGLTWWRYEAIECDEASLPAFLDRCGPDWAGVSLTMPLKRAALALLDRLDPLVTDVGAANTVLFAAAQRLGYNTDVPGMVRALLAGGLSDAGPVRPLGPALIIGGGATACAALGALRDLGERSATVLVRDLRRAGDLRAAAARLGVSVQVRLLDPGSSAGGGLSAGPGSSVRSGLPVALGSPRVLDAFAGHRLIISTIPAGAADSIAEALASLVPVPEFVFDVVYHPWPTPLAKAAARAGVVVVGGLDLLLHQAALQVELMTGRPAPIDEMRQAGLDELRRRSGK
jgi:shikimate 5-dehydrogenase